MPFFFFFLVQFEYSIPFKSFDRSQADRYWEISRKNNFPIETYAISFLCILLFFNLLYLRNEQNNFNNNINSDILTLLLFNKILNLNLTNFAAQFFFKKMILDFK